MQERRGTETDRTGGGAATRRPEPERGGPRHGGVADLIGDTLKRGKNEDVILPLTVRRGLDCVLVPSKRKVLAVQCPVQGRRDHLDPGLGRASCSAFCNTSRYGFGRVLGDAHVAQNRASTSPSSAPTCATCSGGSTSTTGARSSTGRAGVPCPACFGDAKVDLQADALDHAVLGSTLEELVRKFKEALDENPRSTFTPRDVV